MSNVKKLAAFLRKAGIKVGKVTESEMPDVEDDGIEINPYISIQVSSLSMGLEANVDEAFLDKKGKMVSNLMGIRRQTTPAILKDLQKLLKKHPN